tara:strand:- start:361 stop:783 length:423 start_codon:yes stop_codon:yes gene_type:complete
MKRSLSEGNLIKNEWLPGDSELVWNKIRELHHKIDDIKNKQDELNKKIYPLIELLEVLIDNNIDKKKEEPVKEEPKKELCYKEENGNVYIYGTNTYKCKDLIKSKFNSTWDKNKISWYFKIFDEYEKQLLEVFPDIIKDQ